MAARVLVFGRAGQVARALAERPGGMALSFAGRDTLDLTAPTADIAGLIARTGPDAVINAAAYTAVDRAESEPQICARLNRDAPLAMAEACAAADIPFAHFSTDYVFDGLKGSPYVESDARSPVNVYGRSKAEGEAALEALAAERGGRGAVIRTSWVFSARGPSFLQSMLRLARDREELGVVDDQHGRPTSADACAAAALALIRRLLDRDPAAPGLVHMAGADAMSWADFAETIFAASRARGGPSARVRRIATAEYPTPAVRPRDTRLDCSRMEAMVGWRPPPLSEALADCFGRMELA